MISFVCILLTFIGYGQPDLILFIHGWIVDGIDGVHVGWLFMLLSWSSQKTLVCWTRVQTTFLPWATIKSSTENDARKAELEENFPNIESPVGTLRILNNTALKLKTFLHQACILYDATCTEKALTALCAGQYFQNKEVISKKCPTPDTVSFLDADNAILV